MLGMQTGYPLYVVGSSTFGTAGGYVMPGLLMGLLQVGWFAVGTFFAARFMLNGFGSNAAPGSLPFILVGVVWGYSMAWIGVAGIQYVARLALYLNAIPLLMILVVFFQVRGGIAGIRAGPGPLQPIRGVYHDDPDHHRLLRHGRRGGRGFRHEQPPRGGRPEGRAGGHAWPLSFAAGLPLLSVAGAPVLYPGKMAHLRQRAGGIGGPLATAMFFLFTIASIPSACFCAFIASNSFSTMLPGVKRMSSTMAGMTVAIVLAVSGVAENLIGFFTIVGASFGPICGAMAADYLLAGKRWAGPREGVNLAGYGAWAPVSW